MKDELKAMLALNGRRLDWLSAQFGLSRKWFDIRLNRENFTPKEWSKITDLVINGNTSKYFSPEIARNFVAKKHNNR